VRRNEEHVKELEMLSFEEFKATRRLAYGWRNSSDYEREFDAFVYVAGLHIEIVKTHIEFILVIGNQDWSVDSSAKLIELEKRLYDYYVSEIG
jgi:hypothetical protein